MKINKLLILLSFTLYAGVSALPMSLIQQGTEQVGTFKAALVVDSSTSIRGLNAEISFDTSSVVVDSIITNFPTQFTVYKNSINTYWANLQIVAAYRGAGSSNVSGVVATIYGRTKMSSGTTALAFNKTRVGSIDVNNEAINVSYVDCPLSLAHVASEDNGSVLNTSCLFTASPNPFSTTVNFAVSGLSNPKVNIYSVDGRKVYGFDGKEGVWNTQKIPNGMYFAVLTNGDFRLTRTLILQR
ncbi:MAG: T9SS type A sorting domain-containing protein [Fibrobacteres bacterium]|nr:T9SS type A sorting domain-containing protein [Fibrobacterota bacterium]